MPLYIQNVINNVEALQALVKKKKKTFQQLLQIFWERNFVF